jgi:uncharacterized protein
MKGRVVIDTNVYLSALIFGGNPRRVVEMIATEEVLVVTSEHIFQEMRRIVHKKFPQFAQEYEAFEAFLYEHTILVSLGAKEVTICRDPNDNAVLETTVLGVCDTIITGDADLLTLQKYENITIVTPVRFVKMR